MPLPAARSTVRGDDPEKARRRRSLRALLWLTITVAAVVAAPAALAAPTVNVTGVSDTLLNAGEPSATVSWDGSEDGTYEIRKGGGIDCAAGSALSPPVGGAYTTPVTENSVVPRTSLDEGANTVRVCLTGGSGTGFADTTVTVDSIAPTGEITAPAANANIRGASVTVSSDSADGGSGVQRAVFERSPAGAGTWTQIGADDTSFPYQVTFDTTAVVDGLYDLRVRSTDDAGNSATSATRTVRVDNTNPTGSITAPAANANLRGAAVTVSASSADGGSGVQKAVFERSPAGAGAWTQIGADDTAAPYEVTFDTTLVGDGLYDLRVTTTDNAGNATTSGTRTVRVDNTNPTGSITAPAANAALRAPSAAVSSNSADGGSGVQKAVFERSPAGANTWTQIGVDDTTAPYGVTLDTTQLALPDGQYDLRVTTTDNAGNAATSAIVTVTVDNTAPTNPTSFLSTSHTPSDWSPDNTIDVTIAGAADAGGSGVDGYSVEWSTALATDPDTVEDVDVLATSFTSPALADGDSHYVHLRTVDKAGNWSATIHLGPFLVDTLEPATAISFPAASGVYNDASWAAGCEPDGGCGTASDPDPGPGASEVPSGIQVIRVSLQRASDSRYWDGSAWVVSATEVLLQATGTSPWSIPVTAVALEAETTYTLRAFAEDGAGNPDSTPASVTFTVDRTGPDSAITHPGNTTAFLTNDAWDAECGPKPAGICGTAAADTLPSPGSVASVEVSIQQASSGLYWNGSAFASVAEIFSAATPFAPAQTVAWSFPLPATSLPAEGTYVIRARAIDSVGNIEQGLPTRTIVLDRTQPTAAVSFPLGLHNAGAWTAGCPTAGFCGTAADAASGVQTVEVAIQRSGTGLWWDGGAFSAAGEQWLGATLVNGTAWSRAFGVGNFPADGGYLLRLRLRDRVGFERIVDLPFGLDTAAPDTSIDSGPSGTVDQAAATFAFSATEQGAGFQCRLDGGAFASCASPTALTGLANGQHTFEVRAIDGAGNVDGSPAGRTWIVSVGPFQPPADTTAPGPVTGVKAVGDDTRVTLTWKSPADADLAAIEIVRRPGKGAASSVVFSGKATTFTDRGLKNGTTYTYTLVAIDASGNRSTSTSIKGKPILRLLFAPLNGTLVRTPPMLSWRTVKGAAFYNVQLYRGKTKVLSIWPAKTKLKLGKSWRFEGRPQALSAGVYTWYVWPAFGSRSNATYGKLLGKATFVVPKR